MRYSTNLAWASQSGLPGNSIIEILSSSQQAGRWPPGTEHGHCPYPSARRPAAQDVGGDNLAQGDAGQSAAATEGCET